MQSVSQEQVDAWYATIVEPLLQETADVGRAWDEPRTSREIVGRRNYPNLRQMVTYYSWFAPLVVAYDQVVGEAPASGEAFRVVVRRLRGALGDLIGLWVAAGLLSRERRDQR